MPISRKLPITFDFSIGLYQSGMVGHNWITLLFNTAGTRIQQAIFKMIFSVFLVLDHSSVNHHKHEACVISFLFKLLNLCFFLISTQHSLQKDLNWHKSHQEGAKCPGASRSRGPATPNASRSRGPNTIRPEVIL